MQSPQTSALTHDESVTDAAVTQQARRHLTMIALTRRGAGENLELCQSPTNHRAGKPSIQPASSPLNLSKHADDLPTCLPRARREPEILAWNFVLIKRQTCHHCVHLIAAHGATQEPYRYTHAALT